MALLGWCKVTLLQSVLFTVQQTSKSAGKIVRSEKCFTHVLWGGGVPFCLQPGLKIHLILSQV